MQFLIQTILIIGIVCGWPEEAYMQNTSNARPGMDGSANRRRELPGRPQVGAIRWDAWTGGEITAQMEQTLGPRKYHFRLPWFAEVLDRDQVRIDGRPQAIMDREIDFAAGAGLDYWAFLLYPAFEENSPKDRPSVIDWIWAAAGHPHGVFQLRPQDLQGLTGAPLADVVQVP